MLKPSNSKKSHECQICGKTFSRRTYLQMHEKIHGEKFYKCDICETAFSQPAGLWMHKKRQSCEKRNLPSCSNTSSCTGEMHEATEDSGRRHRCDVCNRGFSQKHVLDYHKRTHTGENPYECTTCGKMFRGAATLKYHERTHTGQKPYKCIFCVKAFTQLGSLRQHCRKKHRSEKVYECEVCKVKFEKYRELSSHKKNHLEILEEDFEGCEAYASNEVMTDYQSLDRIQDMNNETRLETPMNGPLVSAQDEECKGHNSVNKGHFKSGSEICTTKDDCDVAFDRQRKNGFRSSNGSIDAVPAHTEEQHDCITTVNEESVIGDKTSKTISETDASLEEDQTLGKPVKHEREYGNENVDGKKYKCSVCNEEFSQAQQLQYHNRTHTYPCAVCNKTFRARGALTVHERNHNGQTPFKCILCPKRFTQSGPLRKHCKRMHCSDQIYECDICKERFEKYKGLSFHKQTHADEPITMAKRGYDDTLVAVNREDEAKPLQEIENALPEVSVTSPIHSLDVNVGDCDSYKENSIQVKVEPSCNIRHGDKHWTNSFNSTNQEPENMDISLSDKRLSAIPRIKQEKEECDFSTDSGIFPETSPLDVNVKSDEHESELLHIVPMQPVNMECEGSDNYMSTMWNRPSRITTGDVKLSLQKSQTFPSQDNVNRSSKTNSTEICTGDEDEVLNCSRVTTPENDHIFSICRGDHPQNSFFDKKSEARSCCESVAINHNTYSVPFSSPNVKHQKWKEDKLLDTSSRSRQRFSGNSTTKTGLRVHVDSDAFCNDTKMLYSNMKFESNVCERQTSNIPGLFGNQVNFAKTSALACLKKSINRGSTDDDNKMYAVLSDGKLKQQCFCLRNKIGVTPEDLQQNPKYELGKTLTGSGTQYICFKCDVLPASSHLV